MKTKSHIIVAAMLAMLSAAAVATTAPTSPSILLENAAIHTVSHGVIQGADLLIEDGKIAALGVDLDAPADAKRIDLAGKHVYPGYIAANSVLGLTEISAVRATNDMSEVGPINPNVRALAAINADSELFPVARANGVLSALIVPQAGNGGLLSGQAALIKLDGWTYEDMKLKAPSGEHLFWPTLRLPSWLPEQFAKKAQESRKQKLAALDAAFRDARAYQTAKNAGAIDTPDLRWEAMLPVLSGKEQLFIHASDILQIRDALAFIDRQQLTNVVLVGGRDAWRLAAQLAQRHIPVILESSHNLPLRRWEAYDSVYRNAAKLAAAGVTLAIANDGTPMASSNERNLPYQAASYAAYGLGKDAALRAITLTPAEILGVAKRMGSLDVGKDATLFVADGEALDIRSHVLRAWIVGHEISLENRQTRLRDKYQRKYQGQAKH
ncbi:MAG: amidohydrolase family protein [Xanthomonadales bacterium]|nr:amidohydrolase family protein [Xanthomonadales bacterium]